jgi:ATP-dependent Clp protease ATP-binding subunit ClpA
MAESISFELWAVELAFAGGGKLVSPLLSPEVVWAAETPDALLRKVAAGLQKKFADDGCYVELLQHTPALQLEHKLIAMPLPRAKKQPLYPELTLPFTMLYSPLAAGGFLAFVPVLGIEAHGDTIEDMERAAVAAVKLEFARRKRYHEVQQIIATQWFGKIEAQPVTVSLDFYTLYELKELSRRQHKKWLPKVATPLYQREQVVYGRDKELSELSRALMGKYLRSVLLSGCPGVGKTALFLELCRRKKEFGIEAEVWETAAARLLQKLCGEGGWQEGLGHVCKELREEGGILFVRNLAELFEVGQYIGNNQSMAEYLREALQRGDIIMVSECSEEESAHIELRSPGYLALFQTVRLQEPEPAQIHDIVQRKVAALAGARKIEVEQEAVAEIIRLQRRYTPYSGFPGKSIRFLETIMLNRKNDLALLDRATVLRHFCEETGMPDFIVDPAIPLPLSRVREFFAESVFGQEEAVATVVNLLAAVKTALTRQGKPIASLMFVGPTGVGKTEMAKVLAHFMFGGRHKLVRFDMSEFSDLPAVLRLTGETTHGGEGFFTAAVRQEPFCVILLDELEKCHYSFYDLLLQILGEGRLTDARGRLASFCSTIVIMTSNIGARTYQQGHIGFADSGDVQREANEHFKSEVQAFFRPELFNRLDQVIAFAPLSRATVRDIVEREVSKIRQREGVKCRRFTLQISDSTLDFLCDKGYDVRYGARHLQRAMREELLIPLATQLDLYQWDTPLVVTVDQAKERLHIEVKSPEAATQAGIRDGSYVHNLAEQVTRYRRLTQQIAEGPYWNRLNSEITMLELSKKKKGEEFWKKDQEQARRYATYVQTRERVQQVFSVAAELEAEAAIAFLDMQTTMPSGLLEKFNNWRQQYQAAKLELYTTLTPKASTCTLGIYGPAEHLSGLADIYLKVAAGRFAVQGDTLWFRDALYQKDHVYLRQPTLKDGPPQSDDKLVGIEIEWHGECPHLYLSEECEERDLHVWHTRDKKFCYFLRLHVGPVSAANTPRDIHRKQFFQDKVERRIYHDQYFKDKKYKEETSGQLAPILRNILDRRFAQNLMAILCNREKREEEDEV